MPDDYVLVVNTSCERDLMFSPGSPVQAEEVLVVLPEQNPTDSRLLFWCGSADCLDGEIPGSCPENTGSAQVEIPQIKENEVLVKVHA